MKFSCRVGDSKALYYLQAYASRYQQMHNIQHILESFPIPNHVSRRHRPACNPKDVVLRHVVPAAHVHSDFVVLDAGGVGVSLAGVMLARTCVVEGEENHGRLRSLRVR